MVNGTTYLATIDNGDIDAWTFPANAGDDIVVRAGETITGSTLLPWLRLYGPDGVLLDADFNASAAEVTTRATKSGLFLVVIADGSGGSGGIGNYRISLAKSGTQPTISGSDEGGPMVNGTTYLAAIETGDVDQWTFSAKTGDSIIVRMGETTAGSRLLPWLRLYGPNGVLLNSDFNAGAAEVSARATNSGLFSVVAADGSGGLAGTGNYRISLVKTGEPLVISGNDEGGLMTGIGTYEGLIDVGDIDAWTFTACAGDILNISLAEVPVNSALLPWLRLYGHDGTLLKSVFSNGTTGIPNFRAPNSGYYTVVIGDGNGGLSGTGNYRLTVNGLSAGLKLCPLHIADGNITVEGIGGVPGTSLSIMTTTDLNTPRANWTPLTTGQFDQFGVFSHSKVYDAGEPQRFFLIQLP